ncbi:MAG: adenylosuccinate synthetase, partial [Euryarchaeota archaeon]|nr:adenylosuccinate synthetase [Euryarchaeota archaeon]
LTKLDVLNGMKKIKVATGYDIDGKVVKNFPASIRDLEKARPIYEEFDGWEDWTSDEFANMMKKGYGSLPKTLRDYVSFIEKESKVKVTIVSLGKERDKTLDLRVKKW